MTAKYKVGQYVIFAHKERTKRVTNTTMDNDLLHAVGQVRIVSPSWVKKDAYIYDVIIKHLPNRNGTWAFPEECLEPAPDNYPKK